MNIKEIKQLLNLIREHELAEFELERDGTRFSVKKYSKPPPHTTIMPPSIDYFSNKTNLIDQNKIETSDTKENKEDKNLHKIISPIVGTFYSSPAPDAAPYVSNDSKVTPNDTICIVEAMKVMNEIKAEVTGTIEKICVENGQAVEFGQALFLVRTNV
ncbi:acetyl-CoA carboxylase, biotin carboxyl carrier protein [bacterium B13(2017)]|nr:acetyl-CoA carboxylase, biotin carboxyl carrier protein [bacterium B13(2017)]